MRAAPSLAVGQFVFVFISFSPPLFMPALQMTLQLRMWRITQVALCLGIIK